MSRDEDENALSDQEGLTRTVIDDLCIPDFVQHAKGRGDRVVLDLLVLHPGVGCDDEPFDGCSGTDALLDFYPLVLAMS